MSLVYLWPTSTALLPQIWPGFPKGQVTQNKEESCYSIPKGNVDLLWRLITWRSCVKDLVMIDTSLIECFGTMSRIKYWICDQDGRVHQRFNSERRLCKRSKLPPTLLQTGGFSFHTKFPWKLRRTNSCDVPEALLSGWHPSSHSFRLLLLYIFLPPKDVSFSFSFILFFPSLSRRGSHLCMGHLSLTKHFPLKSSRSPWSKTSPTCQVH